MVCGVKRVMTVRCQMAVTSASGRQDKMLFHGSGRTAEKLFEHLQTCPIVDVGGAAEAIGVSFNTAQKAILKLVDCGILRQIGTGRRNRVFAYDEYLAILSEGTE